MWRHMCWPGSLHARTSWYFPLGGGIVLRPENRAQLRQHCHVVYLTACLELLLRRVRNDRSRPLLRVADPMAKLRELHAVRHPLYQDTADVQVQADAGTRAALQAIARYLQQQGIPCPAELHGGGGVLPHTT